MPAPVAPDKAKTFCRNVRRCMAARGWEARDLARAADLSESTVYRYMDEGELVLPHAEALMAMAGVFGVSTDALLGVAEADGEMEVRPVVEWTNLPLVLILRPGESPADVARGWTPVPAQSLPPECREHVLCVFIAPDDAMRPTIEAGDSVLVCVDEEVQAGGIALLWDSEHECDILRRVHADGVGISGYADNASYPPRHLPADAVVGRVKRLIGRDL